MKNLRTDIKNKTFRPCYLLCGNEEYLKRSFKRQLVQAISGEDTMNVLEVGEKAPDASELKAFTDTLPFFAEKRLVVLQDTGLFKNASEGYDTWIAALPPTAHVIFIESETDKRNRLYKKVSECGYIAECSHPDEKELKSWLLKIIAGRGLKIRTDAYELFLSCISEDMDDVKNEIEKLCDYAMDTGVITKDDVMAVCRVQLKNRIFDMTGKASQKEKEEAFRLYFDLLSLHESPMRILALLERQIGQLYSAKILDTSHTPRDASSKALGISPYIYDRILRMSGRYTRERLSYLLDYSLDLEKRVKSGDLNETHACDLLLSEMTR